MFYGYHNHYGLNTTDDRGNRIGYVVPFVKLADLNDWISEDERRRERVSRTVAVRDMCDCIMAQGQGEFTSVATMMSVLPTEEIVSSYLDLVSEMY